MRLQRLVQSLALAGFLWLLLLNAFPPPDWIDVDLFLRLDPLLSVGTMLAGRAFVPRLGWALAILAAAFFLGRFFCGYLCPMGVTIDLWDRLARGRRRRAAGAGPVPRRLRRSKYLIWIGVMGAAAAGFSLVFWFSPLSLVTRFYGLALYPLLLDGASAGLGVLRPAGEWFGWEGIRYLELREPVFATGLFVACLVMAVLLLGWFAPRFWCRYLCPAGAMLALCSRRPLLRRRVSDACVRCGKCAQECPMGAIREDFFGTDHQECIVCLKCRDICPTGAISFGPASGRERAEAPEPDMERRHWIGAGLTGFAAGALSMNGLGQLFDVTKAADLRSSRLVRPPGALPERAFQARCVRCGACIKGCPTNTLQAVWFEAGLDGIWTPKVTARLAACEQFCALCGQVCPTGAIRPLPLGEKMYAKIGTARIIPSRCIAWEQEKSCLICDEICPYNAIVSRFIPGHSVTVPFIQEDRCNGCGYCESKCPVDGESAVVVEVLGEVRLTSGSYRQWARERGLVFEAKQGLEETVLAPPGEGEGASGPAEAAGSRLPPGFDLED
ncbi:4Fe-4S binding protein [Desulfatiglans anilini]|uniref:4Fe-4S binding protein n=1 Tax=Desulfatiglans anilini TaxID=90728 RepID=UPI000426D396|nr:4Fe-4S binding protein [Desulfatiglans anilini]